MNLAGDLKQCQGCARDILVERALAGTNHTSGTMVNCWDCLSEEQRQKARELYGIETAGRGAT